MRNKLIFFLSLLILFSLSFSFDFQKFYERVLRFPDKIYYFTSFDGVKLAYRVIVPENINSVLIFIHGISVYGRYYLPFAQEISKYGVKVYLLDIRGHGNSEGRRGDAPDRDSIIKDLEVFYDLVVKQSPNLPIYLGGHSMGAGLSMKFVFLKNIKPAGLILIAGGLPVENPSRENNILRIKSTTRFLFFTAYIFPHFRIIGWDLPKEIKDPLLVNNYSYMFFKAVFPSNIKEIWEKINIPIIAVVGDKDEFYSAEEVIKVFNAYKKSDRKFVLLEDIDHFDVLEYSVPYIRDWIIGG